MRGLGTSTVDELLAFGMSGGDGEAAEGSTEDIMMVLVEAQGTASSSGRVRVTVGYK